jgi:hypothetical protein
MAQKTVQLSVRVSDDDAAFLASLEIEGALTPSEKMRAILRAERQRHGAEASPSELEDTIRSMMRRARLHIRTLEKERNVRSDLIAKLYERVPELAGTLMAGLGRKTPEEFEAAVAADLYALIEEALSLALVSQNRVYDARVAIPHLPPVLELAELIRTSQQQREEENDR